MFLCPVLDEVHGLQRGTVEPCQTEAPGLTGETAGRWIWERGMYRVTAASKSLDSKSHMESSVNKGAIWNHLSAWSDSHSVRDDKGIINHLVQPLLKNFKISTLLENIAKHHRKGDISNVSKLFNFVCMCVCLHVCALVCVWRSEDNLQKFPATKWDMEIEFRSSTFTCWAVSPAQKYVMLSKESYSKVICISRCFSFLSI